MPTAPPRSRTRRSPKPPMSSSPQGLPASSCSASRSSSARRVCSSSPTSTPCRRPASKASEIGPDRVRRLADEANARFEVKMSYADGSTEEQNSALAEAADVIFAAGPAGKQLLSLAQLKRAKSLLVVTDVNAVPPAGIEGVGDRAGPGAAACR